MQQMQFAACTMNIGCGESLTGSKERLQCFSLKDLDDAGGAHNSDF